MNYREIIKLNVEMAIKKREASKTEREIEYWNKVIATLISDLKDYEGKELWFMRKPRMVINMDDILRRFFEEW